MRSDNVLPMPSRRPPLFAHPAGVPLAPDPELVGGAAYALASLAGVDWATMTPTRLEEFRHWACLAATCADTHGLRLVAYSIGKTCDEAFVDMPRAVRRNLADKIMGAVRGAASRCAGVSNPDAHAKLLRLIEQDDAGTPKGGW